MTPDDDHLEAEIRALLRAEHRQACDESHPPAAGLVWWRAELRARHDAVRTAARPMIVMQALALACAGGGAVALWQLLTPWLRQWLLLAAR